MLYLILSVANFCMSELGNIKVIEKFKILLVSRTRLDSHFFIEMLKDPCFEFNESNIFDNNTNHAIEDFIIFNKQTGKTSTLSFAVFGETGLSHSGRAATQFFANEELVKYDDKFTDTNQLQSFNIFIILFSFDCGINQRDIDIFQSYLDQVDKDNVSICICISGTECRSQLWKGRILMQFIIHPFFGPILKQDNIHLCFIGCIKKSYIKTISSIHDLKLLYENVSEMRESLLEIVLNAKELND